MVYPLLLQQEKHNINGRDIEVKAAVPKSRGGGQKATNKLFVGGVPVCSQC
jgi:hypothetical protein